MRGLLLTLALTLVGCGDNSLPGASDGPSVDPDGPPVVSPLAPCIDRPADLPRPPTGQLSCDLLPPGFVAP